MKETGLPPQTVENASVNTDDLVTRLLERSSRQLTLATSYSIALVEKDLEIEAEKATSMELRRGLYSAAAMLRIEKSSRALRVADALKKGRLNGPIELTLGILGVHDQELHIAAIDISKKVVDELSSDVQKSTLSYEAFRDRCAFLFQASNLDAMNPIGSTIFSHAACSVFQGLTDNSATDSILRQILVLRLTPTVIDVVIHAHQEMLAAGVLPNWQPRAYLPKRAPTAAEESTPVPLVDKASSGTVPRLDKSFDRMGEINKLAAANGEKLGQAPLAEIPNPAENMAWLPTLQPVVDIERDAVAFAHSVGVLPYSRESRRYYFGNARKRLADSGLPKGQLAAVDVVSALFDYVVDDKRLPESAKPLFWRLQQPSLALTLLDSSYLADEPRSLRRLIENFGAIVTAFPDDVSRGSELFRRLETVIRAVEIVASSLQTRSAVMSRQVDLEFGKAANSITQLIDRVVRERQALEQTPDRRNRRDFGRRPTRAQEQSVTDKLKKLIDERIGQHDVPDSAREFITQVWMRHLRTSVLRDGEDSQQYKVSLAVVDDLLWSLDNTKRSKTKLATKIPPLIRLLTQGMREIGAKDDEYKPFFDEIFLMHLRKMQSNNLNSSRNLDGGGEELTTRSPIVSKTEVEIPQLSQQIELPTKANISEEISNSPVKLPPELLRQAGLLNDVGENSLPSMRIVQKEPLSVDPPPVPTLRDTIARTPEPTLQNIPEPIVDAPLENKASESVGSDQLKLLDVLNGLDLSDFNAQYSRLPLQGVALTDQLVVGRWVEMIGKDSSAHYAKIAWINHRRSVALLVRSPDRKAQSLRISDIELRAQEKRFFLLG
jgi:Protein of unknown function (DUF1631)